MEKLLICTFKKLNKLKKWSTPKIHYSQIDEKILREILIKYNNIVLFNSTIEESVFDNYSKQMKRKEYLNELYKCATDTFANANGFCRRQIPITIIGR